MTRELNICHDTISNLRTENVSLIAEVEKSNVCHDSIANIRDENASLLAKIEKLNTSLASLRNENEKLIAKASELNVCKPSTSTVDHVTICTRCRDVNVDAINDHLV